MIINSGQYTKGYVNYNTKISYFTKYPNDYQGFGRIQLDK